LKNYNMKSFKNALSPQKSTLCKGVVHLRMFFSASPLIKPKSKPISPSQRPIMPPALRLLIKFAPDCTQNMNVAYKNV
jgi:hypothetical protein